MTRFNKTAVLATLDRLADAICKGQRFDRGNGTAQLRRTSAHENQIDRAVEYGRMRAFEDFARMVRNGDLDSP